MKIRILSTALALAVAVTVFADAPKAPAVGAAAPAFSLPSQEGKTVSLADMKGKWVVLYFYPKDFTGGCTMEAHNFQRDLDKYTAKNAAIVGVSLDSVDSHKSFCTKEALNFKLLSDADHKVATAYDSVMEHNGTTYAARHTYLIDPTGVVRKTYMKVDPTKHSEEVLADLEALQIKK